MIKNNNLKKFEVDSKFCLWIIVKKTFGKIFLIIILLFSFLSNLLKF